MEDKTIILVTDQLPVALASRASKNDLVFPSIGAIPTTLDSLSENYNYIWVGWAGAHGESGQITKLSRAELIKQRIMPVNLSKIEYSQFHEGFCRGMLWPYFHYQTSVLNHSDKEWDTFYEVNRRFANIICQLVEDMDCKLVWIHGFQLLLLPGLLRELIPDIVIGLFLHVPFPSYETFRSLHCRTTLLKSLLAADLIGLQTSEHYRHFLSSVDHLVNDCIIQGNLIAYDRHIVTIDILPMPVDYRKIADCTKEDTNLGHSTSIANITPVSDQYMIHYCDNMIQCNDMYLERLKSHDRKIILTLCRMDYTKGLPHTIKAYRRLLQMFPEYIEKIVLLLIVVDLKDDVCLNELRSEICTLIGSVNGHFTTFNWEPIKYLSQILLKSEIINIYRESDICLVASLRDGMNLVCKEYIAAKDKTGDGVLILSEFAGAAEQFYDSLQVNPYDELDVVVKLRRALEMSRKERIALMRKLQAQIRSATVSDWANKFISHLKVSAAHNARTRLAILKYEKIWKKEIIEKFRLCSFMVFGLSRCSIAIDNNNVTNKENFQLNSAKLWRAIQKLALLKSVIILSHEDKPTLDKWFPSVEFNRVRQILKNKQSIILFAEGGNFCRNCNETRWKSTRNDVSEDTNKSCWKPSVRQIINETVRSAPGTHVSESLTSICWDHTNLFSTYGRSRALQLVNRLLIPITKFKLKVSQTHHFLQISENKGINIAELSACCNSPFIAICDKLSAHLVKNSLSKSTTSLSNNNSMLKRKQLESKIINIIQFRTSNVTNNYIAVADLLDVLDELT
ncbi:hypothetical protein GJ496_000973 [Pomphorhynchus laevis]|nr:hypothetical protein GJ496_000973 [Pomphorhynchus laevis]